MDLVEVAPTARPPVCRIMDYGKWRYQQQKKEDKSRASSRAGPAVGRTDGGRQRVEHSAAPGRRSRRRTGSGASSGGGAIATRAFPRSA